MKFLLNIWASFPRKEKRKEILLRKQCGLKKNIKLKQLYSVWLFNMSQWVRVLS